MPRPKKPTYEYVARLDRYRKRVKDADGKYVAIYGKTPEELTEKLEKAKQQIDQTIIDQAYPTLSAYADKWLELHTPNVSTATKRDYGYVINHFIKKTLGEKRLVDITQDDVKTALLQVSDKSESVYRKTVMLFKQIFESAVDSEIVLRSPCRKLGIGGRPAKAKAALTDEQVNTLLSAIKDATTDIYPFVMVGLYAGLRREEILGLKWKNVILEGEAPHISVRTALRWENNRPVISEELKSKAANRNVPIPKHLVECLRMKKELGCSEYVFADKDGRPKTETQFRNMWHSVTCRMVKKRVYKKYVNGEKIEKSIIPQKGEVASHRKYQYTIDFDVTPHILRHTYITNLLLAGVDVKTVHYLAGHEHAKITLDIYAHLTYNQPRDIIGKINQAFSG